MSRKKGRSSAPAVRLPEEVRDVVNRVVSTTGWTETTALRFLAVAGWNALGERGTKTEAYRRLVAAAVEHHEAELAAKKKLAASGAKLRDARKALSPPEKRR